MCLAVPSQIIETYGENELDKKALVQVGSVTQEISLVYVPEAGVGDYVLVHVGFAISQIDEEEALKVTEYINQIGSL